MGHGVFPGRSLFPTVANLFNALRAEKATKVILAMRARRTSVFTCSAVRPSSTRYAVRCGSEGLMVRQKENAADFA